MPNPVEPIPLLNSPVRANIRSNQVLCHEVMVDLTHPGLELSGQVVVDPNTMYPATLLSISLPSEQLIKTDEGLFKNIRLGLHLKRQDMLRLKELLDEALRVTEPKMWRVKEIAEKFQVTEHTVISWIDKGLLRAINVARKPEGKPRWRIPQENLAEFEETRQPNGS